MADENVTSVLNKSDLTAEEIIADAASQVVNYLYIIHGSGSDRDRRITIEQFKEWISKTLIGELTVGTGANYVEIKDVKIKFNKSNNSFEISMIESGDDAGNIAVSKKIVSANGFKGALTGNVYGNVVGNVTGNVVGNVTGNLTGNVTGTIESGETATGKLRFEASMIRRFKGEDTTTAMVFSDDGLSISNRTKIERLAFDPLKMISSDSSVDLTSDTTFTGSLEPKEGDIVVVKNVASSAISVTVKTKTVQSTTSLATVDISTDCSMAFICVGKLTNQDVYLWSPLCNATVTWAP